MTIGLSAITEMLRKQNKVAEDAKESGNYSANQLTSGSLMDMLGNPLRMKRMMASQFTDSGVMESGLGTSLNQLLISDRNEAAMRVLQKEMAQGKKKIGIFYGAAHMPDFETRLVKNFGLKKTKQVWVDAWDVTKAPKPSANSTTKMLMNMLNELGK